MATKMESDALGALQLQCYRKGREVLPYFPNVMNIETTNRCNLACTICPGRDEPQQGFLDFDFFKARILPELSRCPVPKFWLHFNGEPLLHPRIGDFISGLTERGFFARLSTNGLLLSRPVIRALIESRLDLLVVSVDASTAATYAAIRGSSRFDLLANKVNELIEAKEKARAKRPAVQVQMVRWSQNDAEVKAFVEFWNRPGVRSIYLKPLSSRRGALELAMRPEEAPYLNSFELTRSPCFYLWDSLVIRWNGKVVPCCADLTGQIELGDLKRSSLWEIWNGEPLRQLRRQQFARRFEGLCGPCHEWADESGFPGREPLHLEIKELEKILAARGRHVFIPIQADRRRHESSGTSAD